MRKTLSESVSPRTRDLPSQDAIERRAYELWEREGHPEGRDIEHWLTAERQIAGAERQIAGADPHSSHPDADPTHSPELAADLSDRRRERTSARRASSTLSTQ